MKQYFFIIFLLAGLSVTAQETDKVVIKAFRPVKTKESFEAIVNGDTIKHGLYIKKVWGKKVLEGRFTNGKRNGQWNISSSKGKLIAEGKYENDKRVGNWKFYSNSGELIQIFDYSKDTLIFYNNKVEKQLFNGYDLIPDNYPDFENCNPIFIGGITNMNSIIERNMMYPQKEYDEGNDAKVIVFFTVEKDGTLSNLEIPESKGELFDNEAKRLVALLSNHWICGIKDGKKIRVGLGLPLIFKVQ